MKTVSLKKNRAVGVYFMMIFIFALSIRIIFAFGGNNSLIADAHFYELTGSSIWQGSGFVLNGKPTAKMCPGYPIFIAGIYSLFGRNFTAIRVVQALADALMCAVIYLIASRLFDNKVGVLSGLLCSLHYYFLKTIQVIRPETLQMFFIVLAVFYWLKWREDYRKVNMALMALSSSIAIMLKANVVFLPFLYLFVELIRFLKNRSPDFKKTALSFLIFSLVFSLPILPWIYRNNRVFNSLIFFTTNYGKAMYCSYNVPEGKKFGIISDDDPVLLQAAKIPSEVERDRFLGKKANEYIVAHKAEVIRQVPIKALFFWSPFDWETLGEGQAVFNFATVFILPFSIAGLFLLRKRFAELITIIMPIIYFFAMSLIFQGLPRYRLAIEPFLIILAAFCIAHLYGNFSKRKTVLLVSLWLMLNFTLFIYSDSVLQGVRFLARSACIW